MHVSLLLQKELEPPEHADDMIQNSQKTLEPTGPTLTGSTVPAGAEPSWHPRALALAPPSPHCTLSSPHPAGWASSRTWLTQYYVFPREAPLHTHWPLSCSLRTCLLILLFISGPPLLPNSSSSLASTQVPTRTIPTPGGPWICHLLSIPEELTPGTPLGDGSISALAATSSSSVYNTLLRKPAPALLCPPNQVWPRLAFKVLNSSPSAILVNLPPSHGQQSVVPSKLGPCPKNTSKFLFPSPSPAFVNDDSLL